MLLLKQRTDPKLTEGKTIPGYTGTLDAFKKIGNLQKFNLINFFSFLVSLPSLFFLTTYLSILLSSPSPPSPLLSPLLIRFSLSYSTQ
jgi:hypothetical protein